MPVDQHHVRHRELVRHERNGAWQYDGAAGDVELALTWVNRVLRREHAHMDVGVPRHQDASLLEDVVTGVDLEVALGMDSWVVGNLDPPALGDYCYGASEINVSQVRVERCQGTAGYYHRPAR